MSENLYKLETTQFSTNLELKLQQQGSKLRGRVAEGFHVGKQASPVQYETPIKSQTPAGRFAPLTRIDSDYERRWVFPQDKELPQLIDSFDMLKTIVDPKSPKLTNAAYAVGRDWDDAIILNATGLASIGVDGASFTQETFDTSKFRITDTFSASATAGLTVAKMREARRILRHYENDLDTEKLTLVIGSQQESDLLGLVQIVSTDFNDKPVLVDGRVTRILGFDIVVMERLPTYTTNVRGCLAFVTGGQYLGMWMETKNTVTIRNDLSGQPWQLYTGYSFGATRLQAGKTIQIGCADGIGAAINP